MTQLCLPVLSSIQKGNLLPRKRKPGQSLRYRGESRALLQLPVLGETQGWEPRGSSSWSALELGTQQLRKSPSPALLLLPQPLGADGFSVYQLPIGMQVRARSSGVFLEKLCFLQHMPGKPWLYCLRHRPHQLQETRGNHVLVSDANGKS